MNWRRPAFFLLIALGLLQTVGYLSGIIALRGIGAATAASPLPIVFSDVRGLETFASDFSVTIVSENGEQTLPITPREYGQFGGPYNRRNVYGAAISYGPRLPERLWKTVFRYGFCSPGTLITEMGLAKEPREITVHIRTKTAGRNDAWDLSLNCRE